jgi:ATP-dependent RNA helicase RhlE
VVYPVDRDRKRELLSHLIQSGRIDRALVFTRTKHGANRLAEQLGRDGIAAAAIHGNKSQGQRVRALDDFKTGRVPILVATEIAARGLDIEELPHVVNFELPMVPEDYVHRIGRTGRAGTDGDAISLVCIDEAKLLRDIETVLRRPIETEVIAGFEPNRAVRAEPIRLRSAPGERPQAVRQQPSRPAAAQPHTAPRGAGSQGPRRPAADRQGPAGRDHRGHGRPAGGVGLGAGGGAAGNLNRGRGPRPGPRNGAPQRPQSTRPQQARWSGAPQGSMYAMPGERLSRSGDRS